MYGGTTGQWVQLTFFFNRIIIINTDHIFTFSLITFDISVLFLCYLYEKCIVSLPGLQFILFLVLNQLKT